jgi:hypothetical protein
LSMKVEFLLIELMCWMTCKWCSITVSNIDYIPVMEHGVHCLVIHQIRQLHLVYESILIIIIVIYWWSKVCSRLIMTFTQCVAPSTMLEVKQPSTVSSIQAEGVASTYVISWYGAI